MGIEPPCAQGAGASVGCGVAGVPRIKANPKSKSFYISYHGNYFIAALAEQNVNHLSCWSSQRGTSRGGRVQSGGAERWRAGCMQAAQPGLLHKLGVARHQGHIHRLQPDQEGGTYTRLFTLLLAGRQAGDKGWCGHAGLAGRAGRAAGHQPGRAGSQAGQGRQARQAAPGGSRPPGLPACPGVRPHSPHMPLDPHQSGPLPAGRSLQAGRREEDRGGEPGRGVGGRPAIRVHASLGACAPIQPPAHPPTCPPTRPPTRPPQQQPAASTQQRQPAASSRGWLTGVRLAVRDVVARHNRIEVSLQHVDSLQRLGDLRPAAPGGDGQRQACTMQAGRR